MWNLAFLSEISKSLWAAFCAVHRDGISTAPQRHDSSVTSSSLGLPRRPSGPALRFSYSR
jgi:hypothetical protein